jgi:predicted nucleotidyltransferase component of viral defense system
MTTRNSAASVRARLLNKARAQGVDFQLLLTRYGLERLLYRLSVSRERDNFLLKGALLFDLWYDVPFRPTRDIDLLGFGLAEIPLLLAAFEGICAIEVDDGIAFDSASIRADEIRKEANYAGIRLTLTGTIDGARCPVQIDVGYGDAVTPAPESARYPVMFGDMPAPTLRVYPRYTVVAEKLEAIISLGMANSRMKDYFDLWVILRDAELDQTILVQAVEATLNRRGTRKPSGVPIGLSEQFSSDRQKLMQWTAFINRNQLTAASLEQTVQKLRTALMFLFQEDHGA